MTNAKGDTMTSKQPKCPKCGTLASQIDIHDGNHLWVFNRCPKTCARRQADDARHARVWKRLYGIAKTEPKGGLNP